MNSTNKMKYLLSIEILHKIFFSQVMRAISTQLNTRESIAYSYIYDSICFRKIIDITLK